MSKRRGPLPVAMLPKSRLNRPSAVEVQPGTDGPQPLGWTLPPGRIAHFPARCPRVVWRRRGRCPTSPLRSANVFDEPTDDHEWALPWARAASWAVRGWSAPWRLSSALLDGIRAKPTAWSAPRLEPCSRRCSPPACRPRASYRPIESIRRPIGGGFLTSSLGSLPTGPVTGCRTLRWGRGAWPLPACARHPALRPCFNC